MDKNNAIGKLSQILSIYQSYDLLHDANNEAIELLRTTKQKLEIIVFNDLAFKLIDAKSQILKRTSSPNCQSEENNQNDHT